MLHHSKIYTDGSKKDEKVGYAVVLIESTIKRRQFSQNSIYSAEHSAIINAIYSTASYNQKPVIITDSLSTIIAVSDRKRSKNPKTQLIRKLIDQVSTNITLLWVPSHVGIPENEAADDAAKEALNKKTHHTETYPPQDLIKWIKEKNEQEQQKKWENSTTIMKERKPHHIMNTNTKTILQ
jgi:ribonuclease HI